MEVDAEDGKVEIAVLLNSVDQAEFLDSIKDLMEEKTPHPPDR